MRISKKERLENMIHGTDSSTEAGIFTVAMCMSEMEK